MTTLPPPQDSGQEGPGQDGTQPLAGGFPRDGGLPDGTPRGWPDDFALDDDFDADAFHAAFMADVEAGRITVPDEEPAIAQGCDVSLGDAVAMDFAELAAMAGADGLAGQGFGQQGLGQQGLGQGRTAGVMRPGPVLTALAERAASDLAALSDDQLLGTVQAWRRLQNHALHGELAAVAEFGRRRRAAHDASVARGDKRGKRDGEHAVQELAMELACSDATADNRMEMAGTLAARLPATFAGMAAGLIDWPRAQVVCQFTRYMSHELAARADQVLAAAAPGMTPARLRRKAADLEMRLAPEGVRKRQEEAARRDRRVEAWRERSGNGALCGRELPVDETLAAKASIDAEAVALRQAGMTGSLADIRALILLDRASKHDPWDRLRAPRDTGSRADGGGSADSGAAPADEELTRTAGEAAGGFRSWEWAEDDRYDEFGYSRAEGHDGCGDGAEGDPVGRLTPLPALLNVIIPAGTLFGWSPAPAQAGSWGLLSPGDTRDVVRAASRHPRTRWCVTVTGSDGRAIAHGCARGRHPWDPGGRRGRGDREGPESQAARVAELLRDLGVELAPVAAGTCDHRHDEARYLPSRKLRHLVRARATRCCAPGCNAQAINCEYDHTVPYPLGKTCECNIAPVCPKHHRCKHAPGWQLEQPEPGIMRWTLPSGRVHRTGPERYEP